jgi:hypothetical protein
MCKEMPVIPVSIPVVDPKRIIGKNGGPSRVARFFLFQTYQNVKNIPNDHTLYQKAIN